MIGSNRLPTMTMSGGFFLLFAFVQMLWSTSVGQENNFINFICTGSRKSGTDILHNDVKFVGTKQQEFLFVCKNAQKESPFSLPGSIDKTCGCLYKTANDNGTKQIDLVKIYIRIFKSQQLDPNENTASQLAGMATFTSAMFACSA